MDKQNMYQYNGLLFSYKKEWNTDMCCNIDKSWKYYAYWKKPVKKGHGLCDLYKISRIDKNVEMKYITS